MRIWLRLLLLGLAVSLTGLLSAPVLAQEAVRTGRLHVIWGDDLSRGWGWRRPSY